MFDKGRYITIKETKLFISEEGNVDGIPIILLHGGLGSHYDFLPLAKYLASDYHLIAIDTRGHGKSELGNISHLSYHLLEQDIAAILVKLNLKNIGIIGHSDGGIVALRLAATYQKLIRFVITVGAHWQMPNDDNCRTIYQNITEDMWRKKFLKQITRYEKENPKPNFSKLFDLTKNMWLGNDDDAYPGKKVRLINSPLLVVHGDDDFLVSRSQAYELTEQVKGARLLNLPFAAHTVLEDNLDDVINSFKTFINNCNTEQQNNN